MIYIGFHILYVGKNTYQDGVNFIRDKFVRLNRNPTRKTVYTHVTCATDTSNIQFVFESVTDIIIAEHLRDTGIFWIIVLCMFVEFVQLSRFACSFFRKNILPTVFLTLLYLHTYPHLWSSLSSSLCQHLYDLLALCSMSHISILTQHLVVTLKLYYYLQCRFCNYYYLNLLCACFSLKSWVYLLCWCVVVSVSMCVLCVCECVVYLIEFVLSVLYMHCHAPMTKKSCKPELLVTMTHGQGRAVQCMTSV